MQYICNIYMQYICNTYIHTHIHTYTHTNIFGCPLFPTYVATCLTVAHGSGRKCLQRSLGASNGQYLHQGLCPAGLVGNVWDFGVA